MARFDRAAVVTVAMLVWACGGTPEAAVDGRSDDGSSLSFFDVDPIRQREVVRPAQEACSGIGFDPRFACCPGLVLDVSAEGRPDERRACCLTFWTSAQDGVFLCSEPRPSGGLCRHWFECASSLCSEGFCI